MEYVSLKIFYTIFNIFLKGDIVQLIIIFNKHTENHLNNKNTKSVQKILKLLQFNLCILYYMTKMYQIH
jgi:hypothetical protein